ncbi:MAG: DUF3800 domain-containing protein [Lactobacillaceae bacterium]|jgi:hypothetical protein|nr:DUF3800 domain-containing protein [Lactobacillaceae bacterium]
MNSHRVTIYLDDAGVLSKNHPIPYFVYGGFAFLDEERDDARRQYRKVVDILREKSGRTDELKAANTTNNSKRKLLNSVKKHHSISVKVDTPVLYDSILANKKSIHRYKDYVIKILVKKIMLKFFAEQLISRDDEIFIDLFIDQQPTSTNGYYGLRDSIFEEFKNGIINWDYGFSRPPLVNGELKVSVTFFDSEYNYLGQAADILANYVWGGFVTGDQDRYSRLPNHLHVNLPK